MNAEERLNQANEAFARGNFATAAQAFRDVIELHPDVGELHINLGAALKSAGDFDSAEAAYRDAIKLLPKNALAWFNLGNLLRDIKKDEEALKAFRKADMLQPGTPEILNNLGTQFYDMGAIEEALKNYDAALSCRPQFADAMTNRGNALQRLCRMDEAEHALTEALAIEPGNPVFNLNMSAFRAAAGQHDQALEFAEKAITLDPNYIEAHLKKASLLIQQGQLRKGLALYEKRWAIQNWHALPNKLDAKRWSGEALHGKSLIVWNEQGFGDAIMYARYLKDLSDRADKLTVMCEPTLHNLLGRRLSTEVEFIGLDDTAPKSDFHVSMMSLPHHFDASLKNLKTGSAYLVPEQGDVDKWRDSLTNAALHVGLIWAGNPKQSHDYSRSLNPELISPILDSPHIQFHNLLVGPRGDLWRDERLHDPRKCLKSFDDSAAYMSALDLVISVDSAPAHLAGAIGKKTWVLLSFDPDTRYFLGRDDSPWYPEMTLYRQKNPGDWGPVIDQICNDLKNF